jgi:signal transduction histidine kinase
MILGDASVHLDEPTFMSRIVRSQQPILLPVIGVEQLRAATTQQYWPLLERLGIHSMLGVPMRVQGRTIGALALHRHRPDRPSYNQDDVKLAQDLADRAALAIENARLFRQVQSELAERARAEDEIRQLNAGLEQRVAERTAELARANTVLEREVAERTQLGQQIQQHADRSAALAELSGALAEASPKIQPLYDTIARHVARLIGDACILSLLSEDGQTMQAAAIGHDDDEAGALLRELFASAYSTNQSLARQVVQNGQAMLMPIVPPEQIRAQLRPEQRPYLDRFGIASLIIVPLRARGHILGALGVSRDRPGRPYTEQDKTFLQDLADQAGLAIENARLFAEAEQARAEAERANRAKSEFLSSMSHELRTPLNAILGFTGTLLMKLPGPLNANQEKQLSTVQRSGKHLLALINDLLDLAKIESGKVELRLAPTVCQAVLDEVAASLRPLAEEKRLRFAVEAPAEPIVLASDARTLSQILINRAGNAIKFTDTGEVVISLLRKIDGERYGEIGTGHSSAVEFTVRDTGIGIAPEDQAKLFTEFGRVDSAATRAREGTGLGLRLSHKLAELLGGRIELQSELGKGSTFTLVLVER